jgi:hypothetical protein
MALPWTPCRITVSTLYTESSTPHLITLVLVLVLVLVQTLAAMSGHLLSA